MNPTSIALWTVRTRRSCSGCSGSGSRPDFSRHCVSTRGCGASMSVAWGASAAGARVLPIAAITRGRRGAELCDLVELAAAGAVAFSDDGAPVSDAGLFRHALEYSRIAGALIVEHPQDLSLSAKGVMHEGSVSAELGLAGMPAAAEEAAVARDLALVKLAGARLHLTHLSTPGSVAPARRAKAEGVAVTW